MWTNPRAAAVAVVFAAHVAAPGAAQTVPQMVTGGGNEPFWSVEVASGTLTLTRLDFADLILSVIGRDTADDGTVTITAATSSPALRAVLTLRPGPCADTMADQTYPFSAEVELGDNVLTGCAGDPRVLLRQVETWNVVSLAGEAIAPGTEVTLSFAGDDVLSGSAGCNRFTTLYEITGEGLSVGNAAATRMACPEPVMTQEMRFFELLSEVVSFDIRDDGGLSLVTLNGDRIDAAAP